MKNNKQNGIRFVLGTYDEEKQKGCPTTHCWKKSQVERRASLLLQRNGYVWLKVVINDCQNEVVAKSLNQMKKAMSCFIEQPLVDYLNDR